MSNFIEGFKNKVKEHPRLASTAAGIGTGLGAYTMMRRGGGPRITKGLMRHFGNTSASAGKKRFRDKIIHGVDDVVYAANSGVKVRTPAQKVEGTLLGEQPMIFDRFKGDTNVGELSNKTRVKLENDKGFESSLISKYMPKASIPTINLGAKHKGRENFLKFHSKQKDNYFIKPRFGGYNSGIGGEGFINAADVKAFASGKRMEGGKRRMLERIMKNPDKHIFQKDINIKSLDNGAQREFRVHAIGKNVITGSSTTRAGNTQDAKHIKKIEKFLQKQLKNLPDSVTKNNLPIAADIAMTKHGPKIIELNSGGFQSGFLDPEYLRSGHNNITGNILMAQAVKRNWALYKHLTGREHMAPAAIKALLAGGGAADLTTAAINS